MKHLVLGMLAHVDAGKTTLSEAMLYRSGTIRRLGRVDNKDAFLDTDEQERKRGITIFSKQAILEMNDMKLTLLDTPGHVDFSAEMERTLQVLDYAVLIISGADGVQSHTETLWRLLARYQIPTFLFVNKMDQQGTKRANVLEQLKNKLSGQIEDFTFPDEEEIALCDEELMEEYLETGLLDYNRLPDLIAERKIFPCFFGSALKVEGIDEFMQGLEKYTCEREYPKDFGAKVFKIARDEQGNRLTYLKVTGGILKNRMVIGEEEKINQIRIYSGEKFTSVNEVMAGEVCAVLGLEKTMAGQSLGSDMETNIPMLSPVLTYKLELPRDVDALQMLPKLKMLEEEEPELHISWNELLKEIHIQVMGAIQIEILQNLIESRFGVQVTFGPGKIVYKETIANVVEGVGHFEPLRHYAEVHLLLEPGELGSGMQYDIHCNEDALAKNWQRLVLTHLCEKTHKGVLTGAPITDIKITLVAGRAHTKHTEGGDFRQATYRAVRQGLMQAESILLEPFYDFTLEVPKENVGRAMTDMERLYGKFTLEQSSSNDGEMCVITGKLPVACVGDYQMEVLSYTKGRGKLSLKMRGYEPCHNQDEVIQMMGYDPAKDVRNPADSVFCSHGLGDIVPWNEVFLKMHVESVLKPSSKQGDSKSPLNTGRVVSDEPLGTDEVDAILQSTFYANRKPGNKKYGYKKKASMAQTKVVYKNADSKRASMPQYLLVDGYNVIHAWKELDELARVSFDGARGRLLDIMCNYQAMKKCELIVVFDAYKVKGHDTEVMDYLNIHVVYTKEAETADQYIEKFAHDNAKKYNIRVATSDGLEQIIIRGEGCHLVSARELETEVNELNEQLRKEWNVQ